MKFLVIRLSSMGDIILTQPVIAALRHRYPDAEIDYVTKPQFVSLVRMLDDRINVMEYRKDIHWHLALRKRNYDCVIDLHGKLSSIMTACCARSDRVVRYHKQRALRKAIVKHTSTQHITSTVDLYATALSQLWNEEVKLGAPRLSIPKPLSKNESDAPATSVAIFPGAAHLTKMYPLNYWQQFVSLNPLYRFIIMGSKAEEPLAHRICESANAALNLCGKLDWTELAATIAQSDLVISGDSGPMHLAAALGKPQIAIFGSTHPRLGFAPFNDKAVILQQDLTCRPCSLHGADKCPLGHFNCMLGITPQMLSDACLDLLGK